MGVVVNKVLDLTYSTSLANLCETNSSFDTGTLKICYVGQNRNGSFISKQTLSNAVKSIYNCPIVCHYDRETDTIGGHDIDLVADSEGYAHIVNLTQPIGCIPESANVWFETFEEDDGSTHEYLCADVLLWKRQEAYRKIKKDGISKHSMEITVLDGETRDNVYVINSFEFTAFAIIGVEPCFEGSSLKMFSSEKFSNDIAEMKKDLKEYYRSINLSKEKVSNKQNQMKGGRKDMIDEKNNLIAEYGFKAEDLDFSIEDISVDELRNKLEALKSVTSDTTESEEINMFELSENIVSEIYAALQEVQIPCEWTDSEMMPKYSYIDYDAEKKEIYCYDRTDWNIYGFAFNFNGDKVEIDFESKKRKKYSIVDFDEGEQLSPFKEVYGQMSEVIKRNVGIEEKYNDAMTEISSLKETVEKLSKFKKDTEDAYARKEKETIIEKFKKELSGIEDFENLCEKIDSYDISEIENTCYIIRGKNAEKIKYSKDSQITPIIPVNKETNEEVFSNEPYGGIVKRLLK